VHREHEPQRCRQRRRESEARTGLRAADAGHVGDDRQAMREPAHGEGDPQGRRATLGQRRRRAIADERDRARHGQHRVGRPQR
jgi:hypothetical protein